MKEVYDYLKDKTGTVQMGTLTISIPDDLTVSVGHPVLVFESSKRYLLFRDSMHIHQWSGQVWTYMLPKVDRDMAIRVLAESYETFASHSFVKIDEFSARVHELHERLNVLLKSA